MRLAIHYPSAATVFRPSDRVTEWARVKARRTGFVSATNPGPKGRKVWVSVYLPRGRQLFSGYTLTLRRR